MAFIELLLMGAAASGIEIEAPPLDPATPARELSCSLARATNIDFAQNQRPEDIRHEGHYTLTFALPSARAAKTAGYLLQADEAHLFGKGPVRFERAVDMWPQRVELATAAGAAGFSYAILTEIDPVSKRANIYVGRGKDMFTPDPAFVYQGACEIRSKAQ